MRLRFVLFGLVAVMLVWMGLAVKPALAADVKVGLRPGETATIPMKYWCLDYGKPFPAAIAEPGERAADDVVAVLLAAISSGAVTSDAYATNLAIWRVRTGEFKDYANLGITDAEKIYNDSLKITVPPIPAGTLTLGDAYKQGLVSVEIKNFTVLSDTAHPNLPGHPFHGTADVVVTNVSKENVEFVFYEGTIFPPSGGEDAQNLLAHLDPQKQPELPKTGAAIEESIVSLLAVAVFGLLIAALGGWLLWRSTRTFSS